MLTSDTPSLMWIYKISIANIQQQVDIKFGKKKIKKKNPTMWHAITNGVLKFQAYDMPFIVAAKPLTKI